VLLLQSLGLRGGAAARALAAVPALRSRPAADVVASAAWVAASAQGWAELAGECRAGSCGAAPGEILAASPALLAADVAQQLQPAATFLQRYTVRSEANTAERARQLRR
jgi:hypothetical protein